MFDGVIVDDKIEEVCDWWQTSSRVFASMGSGRSMVAVCKHSRWGRSWAQSAAAACICSQRRRSAAQSAAQHAYVPSDGDVQHSRRRQHAYVPSDGDLQHSRRRQHAYVPSDEDLQHSRLQTISGNCVGGRRFAFGKISTHLMATAMLVACILSTGRRSSVISTANDLVWLSDNELFHRRPRMVAILHLNWIYTYTYNIHINTYTHTFTSTHVRA